jgi:hypothetical protein
MSVLLLLFLVWDVGFSVGGAGFVSLFFFQVC